MNKQLKNTTGPTKPKSAEKVFLEKLNSRSTLAEWYLPREEGYSYIKPRNYVHQLYHVQLGGSK
jgi:hypothetical protein